MRTSTSLVKMFIGLFMCIMLFKSVNAQTIHIVANPIILDSTNYFPAEVNIINYPVIFHGKLYVLFTKYLSNYLAESDGISLKIVPKQNDSITLLTQPIVFQNNLFYSINMGVGDSTTYGFIKYDGTNLTVISTSSGSAGALIQPTVYNNRLYYYNDVYFDGTSFLEDTLVNITSGVFGNYNGNLIFSDSGQISSYDGHTTVHFPNPDSYGYCEYFSPGVSAAYQPIEYNNQLYFEYTFFSDSLPPPLFAQFNGSKVTTIAGPGGFYGGYPFIYNSELYFDYVKNDSVNTQLAKYDGNNFTIIPNPDNSGSNENGGKNGEVSYLGNLYFIYSEPSGKSYLAQCNGTSIKLLQNPDSGDGFYGALYVYNGKLYAGYSTLTNKSVVIQFDGSKFKTLTAPPGAGGFQNPIIYNNKLYFESGGHLAYLDDSILPVTLLSFNAQKQDKSVLLNWQTANEVNNSYFSIERSANGGLFTSIGKVAALKTSAVNNYAFTDNAPLQGNNYYRLKQVDKDGKFTYSNIATVNFAAGVFSAAPNPASNIINLTIPQSSKASTIILYDAEGRSVLSQHLSPNITTKQIDISALAAGIYTIILNQNGNRQTVKVVKK